MFAKMDRSKIFLITGILIIIVISSGCLGPNRPAGKLPSEFPGLVITNFIASSHSIDAGETTTAEVDFDNVGEQVATEVRGDLIRKGSFVVSPAGVQSLVADIEPPITDVPGGDAFLWDLTAPQVTQDRLDEVQARVFYKYKTDGFGTVHFVPRDILREKGINAFQLEPSSTLGPLDIEIVANQPFIIRPAATTIDARFTVLLSNVGPGKFESDLAPLPTGCNKALDCIDTLTLQTVNPNCIDDATGLQYLKTIPGVRLVEGNAGKLTEAVTFRVTDANAATSCQIRATANYRYRIDSSVLRIEVQAIQ